MSIGTNFRGRLRNTSLPLSHGLMPLFEAVVNSIHAIEEAGLTADRGEITIEIIRNPQQQINYGDNYKKAGRDACENIIGFKIIDNGIGFNDENMESFETLDSEHKASKGGRGVGRLLWLKAFKKVSIESIYADIQNSLKSRRFTFTISGGVSEPVTSNAHLQHRQSHVCIWMILRKSIAMRQGKQ